MCRGAWMRNVDFSAADLIVRFLKALQRPEKPAPKKDVWDKFATISGLLSGILVAGIGFYATEIYDRRSRDVELAEKQRNTVAVELQTIEKFFTHLNGPEGPEKMAAIEIVAAISNGEVGGKIANAYRGPSARAAFMSVANASTKETKPRMENILSDLYRRDSGFVYYVGTAETGLCSGFAVSEDGRLLTASHCIPKISKTQNTACVKSLNIKKIDLSVGRADRSRKLSASLITWDDDYDIALLKIDIAERTSAGQLSLGDDVDFGADVVAISVASFDQQMQAASGRLADYSLDRLSLTAAMAATFAGSPILNSDGMVVGMLTRPDVGRAIGVPNRVLRRLMQACDN
jgi:S1-C subfamily serine protease